VHFEILQSISANGTRNKANDDRVGATHTRAWVIDGATDMGPPGLLGAQGWRGMAGYNGQHPLCQLARD